MHKITQCPKSSLAAIKYLSIQTGKSKSHSKVKKSPTQRHENKSSHVKAKRKPHGCRYAYKVTTLPPKDLQDFESQQFILAALACCQRSLPPQAETTLKQNITCHPLPVLVMLFVKGSRRDQLSATTKTENSFVNLCQKVPHFKSKLTGYGLYYRMECIKMYKKYIFARSFFRI